MKFLRKKLLQKTIEINPKFAESHNNLGNAFKELGNYQDTIACYQSAIKLNLNERQMKVWLNQKSLFFKGKIQVT